MSLSLPTPSSDTPGAPQRSRRILACILCQHRKVKCDRNFPCANCLRQNAKCVPATAARRRRRRFPERDLLARLQRYEELLRQHNVAFDPLHNPGANVEAQGSDGEASDDNLEASPADSTYEPRCVRANN